MSPIKEKQDILIPDIVDKNIPNRNGFIYVLSGSGGSDEDDTPDIQYSCVVIDDMADSLKNNDIQKQLSKINVKQVIQDLNNNILPVELMFVKNEDEVLDLSKLQYNTFYRTIQHYDSLMPKALKNIPGYERILEKMIEDNQYTTLSQAMDLRKINLSNRRENKVFTDKENNPYVVFTGTRKFGDVISDGLLAVGLQGLDSRFRQSKRLVDNVRKKYNQPITTVGHSLGGSLAEYAGGNKVITVDKGVGIGKGL
eukprot:gene15441-20833_t